MGISIKDIARKAKVAPSTVSRVINGSPKIGKATREKVLRIIKEMNYRPNLAARNLIKGQSDQLTLVLPDASGIYGTYYFHQILNGISDVLQNHSYRLTIFQPKGYDQKLGYPPELGDSQGGGLFIIAPLLEDRLVKLMEIENQPTVLINGRSSTLDWVDLDNIGASIQIMDHFHRAGHRRIAFILGMGEGYNARDRLEGYKQGLARHGLPFRADFVLGGKDYSMESGYHAAKNLLSLPEPPTAVYATSDMLALGVIRAARDLGRTVPRDLSVFGFDDTDLATLTQPALCTVRQPFYSFGRVAAETLIARLQNPKTAHKTVELKGEIILRDSSKTVSSETTQS